MLRPPLLSHNWLGNHVRRCCFIFYDKTVTVRRFIPTKKETKMELISLILNIRFFCWMKIIEDLLLDRIDDNIGKSASPYYTRFVLPLSGSDETTTETAKIGTVICKTVIKKFLSLRVKKKTKRRS